MGLGRIKPADAEEPFCMTVLALKLSRAANAVSELHGRGEPGDVAAALRVAQGRGKMRKQVPIGHITNGIHVLGWMKGTVRRFWRKRRHGRGGRERHGWRQVPPEFWGRAWRTRISSPTRNFGPCATAAPRVLEFARRRLLLQGHRVTQKDFIAFDHLLNPDALTIGFARRFATYKRAPLVFQQFDEMVQLARDRQRPVQFVFAGKAHPRDDDGKRFIQHIIHLSKYSELKGTWCLSRTTTSTWRGRWCPAAMSG